MGVNTEILAVDGHFGVTDAWGGDACLVHRQPIHGQDLEHGRVLVLFPVIAQADAHAIQQPVDRAGRTIPEDAELGQSC